MKTFVFTWHQNEKYHEPSLRINRIEANDVTTACICFMRSFGNLKKNTIEAIREIDPYRRDSLGEVYKDDVLKTVLEGQVIPVWNNSYGSYRNPVYVR